ncbi:hypothetical protein FKM82_012396 [Ascaphus truei]
MWPTRQLQRGFQCICMYIINYVICNAFPWPSSSENGEDVRGEEDIYSWKEVSPGMPKRSATDSQAMCYRPIWQLKVTAPLIQQIFVMVFNTNKVGLAHRQLNH